MKKLTAKQVVRVQSQIKYYISMAKYVKADAMVKALEVDMKYCSNWTVEEATRILTLTKRDLVEVYGYTGYKGWGVGVLPNEEYIYNTVIKGLKTYHAMHVRTYQGSTTKNKIIIKMFHKKDGELCKTRKQWLDIGKQWLLDNNINDDTISFEMI